MADWAGLMNEYVTGRVRRGEITPLTGRNARSALGSLVSVVDTSATITPRTIDRWMRRRAHLSAASRRSDFSTARAWCDWLVSRRVLRSNPTAVFKAPKEPRRAPRALSTHAVAQLLEVCPDTRSRAVVWLMVGLGLRCCEVAGLRVEDWDRHDQVVRIVGKGGHERIIPMVPEVATAVGDYLAQHPATDGPLVRSYREPWQALAADTISGQVSELMKAAGIKRHARDGVSAHALRHTCASDVLDASHDLTVVQELLGHQNLSTTAIYLRRAGIARMREAMGGRDYDDAA